MNIHKNARTTPQSRAILVRRVLEEHWPVSAVATVVRGLGAHRLQVAGAVPRRRGGWVAGSALRRPPPAACLVAGVARGDPSAAARQAGGGGDRCPTARGALDGERRAGSAGTGPPVRKRHRRCRCSATNGRGRASWSTWTPRSWGASCDRVIGSPAITATRSTVRGGNMRMWRSTTAPATPTSRCCPDEKRYTTTGFLLRALREFRRRGIRSSAC